MGGSFQIKNLANRLGMKTTFWHGGINPIFKLQNKRELSSITLLLVTLKNSLVKCRPPARKIYIATELCGNILRDRTFNAMIRNKCNKFGVRDL